MTFLLRCARNWHHYTFVDTTVQRGVRCFSNTTCKKQSLAPLNFIGKRCYPTGSDSFELREPATGKLLGVVQCSGEEDIASAVLAAGHAFEQWSALSGIERAQVLRRAADIVRQRQDEIAKWDSVDTGWCSTDSWLLRECIMHLLKSYLRKSDTCRRGRGVHRRYPPLFGNLIDKTEIMKQDLKNN